jgi:hypothetical protein
MTGIAQHAKDDALPFSNITRTRQGDLTVLTVRGEATPAARERRPGGASRPERESPSKPPPGPAARLITSAAVP